MFGDRVSRFIFRLVLIEVQVGGSLVRRDPSVPFGLRSESISISEMSGQQPIVGQTTCAHQSHQDKQSWKCVFRACHLMSE